MGFTRPYSCISPARRLLQGGLHRFHHQLDAARRRRTARVVSGRLDVGVEGDREGEGTAGGRLDQGDLAGEELALPGAAPRRSRQFSERLRASRRALSTSGPRRLPGRSPQPSARSRATMTTTLLMLHMRIQRAAPPCGEAASRPDRASCPPPAASSQVASAARATRPSSPGSAACGSSWTSGGRLLSPGGVTARIERGEVVSCEAGAEQDADAWALGSLDGWLDAVINPEAKTVRTGGD